MAAVLKVPRIRPQCLREGLAVLCKGVTQCLCTHTDLACARVCNMLGLALIRMLSPMPSSRPSCDGAICIAALPENRPGEAVHCTCKH